MTRIHLALTGALALTAPLTAQSTIFGVDFRNDQTYTSTTDNFVSNFMGLATEPRPLYGIDFNASATTLYAIDNATLEILTIDTTTGASTPTGTVATGIVGLSGLTASPDGVTWYVCDYDGTDTILYRGSISTGVFTQVGILEAGGITIDISMDSQGNLYGLSISTDSLLTIDTVTGAGTVIGPIGLNPNFAQGMDFDWSTDTLYATVYTGGGTGKFCSIDLATGLANQLEDTFVLNAEMEMAVQRGVTVTLGTNYCMANPNSTGTTGSMSAMGSALAVDNDVTLTASSLPNNAFGFFLTSEVQSFVANPGGSDGNICLGGQIGRYVGPGQIQNTGAAGEFSLVLDLTQTPTPTGFTSILAGETWNFQAWHRDSSGGTATSNFTDGLQIDFQ